MHLWANTKVIEKQNKVKSGYVKFQRVDIWDEETRVIVHEGFFISTPKDLKYLVFRQQPKYPEAVNTDCKLNHANIHFHSYLDRLDYDYDDEIDAKYARILSYPTANGISVADYENCRFERIPPKMNKKNIRYKIAYPDQEEDLSTDISREWEFDRKSLRYFQTEYLSTFGKANKIGHKIDILEQRLYNYIHPDILDTISATFATLKKGYDRQYAAALAKKDSAFRDSIMQSFTQNGHRGIDMIPEEEQQDTLILMPEWKFPLLSGDTLYSDSIKSQFLLIDMWYIGCAYCRLVMRELASIDTLYDESLLKMVSINVYDTDTVKISKVVKSLNLKSDIACAYKNNQVFDMSKVMMDKCQGYPQLYLIDMKTKRVIWNSCGWDKGFTKEIEAIIKGGG